ncbi:serine protein kinase RIO [Candidatus Micrarchaeota archaeon]|nr:MAG: serine protein kinase RIO [Candidatus Micrarchaeota archaeon]
MNWENELKKLRVKRQKDSEHFKIFQRVFDEYTIKNIRTLIDRGIFRALDFPVSTGKEADVYRGSTRAGGYVAVKIYRIETGDFKNMWEYILGDPRFKKVGKGKRALIREWCKKEFRNLSEAYNIGIRVPQPFAFKENVLVMEFIGENGEASPLLKDVKVKQPKALIDEVITFIQRMYSEIRLVHADISEFNIMMKGEKPYLIDMGQAVNLKHPRALEFLKRDLYNVERMAKKMSVEVDHEKMYRQIVGV